MIESNSEPEIRKAAILIDSLDEQSGKLLLSQLNNQNLKVVQSQIEHLNSVSLKERESVLAEFLTTVQLVSKEETTVQ